MLADGLKVRLMASRSGFLIAEQDHKSLVELDLNGNTMRDKGVAAVCLAALSCRFLKHLHLRRTFAICIPLEFQIASHAIAVDLSENDGLRSPPAVIASRSPIALAEYWADLRADHQTLDTVRLMMVGFGGVGKTTLAKALSLKTEDLPNFQSTLKGDAARRSCNCSASLDRVEPLSSASISCSVQFQDRPLLLCGFPARQFPASLTQNFFLRWVKPASVFCSQPAYQTRFFCCANMATAQQRVRNSPSLLSKPRAKKAARNLFVSTSSTLLARWSTTSRTSCL